VGVFAAPPAAIDVACARAIRVVRRSTARACALISHGVGALRCTVELAGDAASVERDAAWLAGEMGAESASDAALAEVQRLQGDEPDPCGLRFRLAVLPDRLAPAAAHLTTAGARLLIYPGLNFLYASFALDAAEGRDGADRLFRTAADVARASAGELLCEAAPPAAKRERDIFGAAPGALSLMRALKARFDPEGALNPGRFAGGL
jgi:FAD/FMN-containing dehydrogenase